MKRLLLTSICCAATALWTNYANSASITWSSAFEVVSDADIDVSSPVVYAVNGGDSIGNANFIPAATLATLSDTRNVVIAGKTVSFQGQHGAYGAGSTFASTTFGDATTFLAGQSGYNVTFGT